MTLNYLNKCPQCGKENVDYFEGCNSCRLIKGEPIDSIFKRVFKLGIFLGICITIPFILASSKVIRDLRRVRRDETEVFRI